MAEKSSKLEVTMVDKESTGDVTANDTSFDDNSVNDTSLQTRSVDDDSLASTEARGEVAEEAEDVTPETEQLREQIEETRRGMGETIDAIQEKLSFSNISEQVKDQVSEQLSGAVETAKDAFYGKAGDIVNSVGRGFRELGKTDLAKKAQQNPTALAIIGAGIGALIVGTLVSDRSKKSRKKIASYRYDKDSYGYDYDSSDDDIRYAETSRRELHSTGSRNSTFQPPLNKAGDTQSSTYKSVSDTTGTAYTAVSGAASSALESVGSVASKTYEGVGSVASKTYEGVGSVAGKTYEGVGTAAGFVYDKAGDLGGEMKVNYEHYIEENPLAVGAVALAIGAAIGFAIPLTKKENEYLGEYRDNVIDKAQATAQDALGTVKQMASEAQKVITDEVKSKTA